MPKPYLPLFAYADPQNYLHALRLARKNLACADTSLVQSRSGCLFDSISSCFLVNCLNHPFLISYPEGLVKYRDNGLEPEFALQLIMLNYLTRSDGAPLTYQFRPFRTFDGGNVYDTAFHRNAIEPLVNAFGRRPETLLAAAALFGGLPGPQAGSGVAVIIFLLPRVPLLFKVWPGDDEIPAGANLLFDASANHYLHTEDLAAVNVVTGLLIINPEKGSTNT